MNNKPIAFFDSGVGGLTVLEKIKKILPNEDYIYFGDLKNVPYGEKSKKELIKIADGIFNFFKSKDVKAVVMACNTTSANAYEELQDKYPFKIYPIIQSSASLISKLPVKKVGILATDATIKSGVYGQELKKYKPMIETFEMSCPPWVGIVEERKQNEAQSVACVQSYLGKILENHPDKIILGCTHYPFLLDVLAKFLPRDMFIDPAAYFVNYIKEDLEANNLLSDKTEGSEHFFVSAKPEQFQETAKKMYPIKEKPTLIQIK